MMLRNDKPGKGFLHFVFFAVSGALTAFLVIACLSLTHSGGIPARAYAATAAPHPAATEASSPEPTGTPEPSPTAIPGDDYVANAITKVYHLPDCEQLKLLSKANQERIRSTPAQMEADGYRPCLSCKAEILRRAESFPDAAPSSVPTNQPTPKPAAASASPRPTQTPSRETDGASVQHYVLNTKSLKFHRPTCEYAEKMADYNRKDVKTTRQQIIEWGYKPCNWCRP